MAVATIIRSNGSLASCLSRGPDRGSGRRCFADLGAEQRERDYRDAVPAPICVLSRVENDGIDEITAHLVPQPREVLDIGIVDPVGELHLYGEDAAVGSLHDEVDLVVAVTGA